MAYDEALAERIRGRLRDGVGVGVGEKKMFGGLVFFTDTTITVGVYGDDLLVGIGPPDVDAALVQPGVRRFTMGGRRAGSPSWPATPSTTPCCSGGSGGPAPM